MDKPEVQNDTTTATGTEVEVTSDFIGVVSRIILLSFNFVKAVVLYQ